MGGELAGRALGFTAVCGGGADGALGAGFAAAFAGSTGAAAGFTTFAGAGLDGGAFAFAAGFA